MQFSPIIIIGAGAAGLFCAGQLAKRGQGVLLLDQGKKVGRKILMSGGGFCNFTNLDVQAQHYISHNPHFVKSALARFTQWDFIGDVLQAGIAYHEKGDGQLFCDDSAKQIVQLLMSHCPQDLVKIQLGEKVESVEKLPATEANKARFAIQTHQQTYHCQHLVVATGGLSMPGLGVSPLGYQIAEQFGLNVAPIRASLVPFTWAEKDKHFSELAGVSLLASVTAQNGQCFTNQLLFTHRGLSGPAILQISNYWQPKQSVTIDLLPGRNIREFLMAQRQQSAKQQLKTALTQVLPARLVALWLENGLANPTLANMTNAQLAALEQRVHHWQFSPNGTEGYRTAEVTLGGVDTAQISSKTMQAHKVAGLYFIGEVLDVTGWLGGYNFQWAWSSAYACAESIAKEMARSE